MNTQVRGRVERPVTPEELASLRARLDALEARYGVPSSAMNTAAEFRDDDGRLLETEELAAWGDMYDQYVALTDLG